MDYQIVLDQSTSGTKLLLLNDGQIIKRYDKQHRQIYPKLGWVEQDPMEILENVEELLATVLKENHLSFKQIKSISITNQRETILAWDKQTGKPLYNAIVWQCNRSTDICEELIQLGKTELINKKTGLRIDPYFSGTKIRWLHDNVLEFREKSGTGNLAVGTIDSWLVWNLTERTTFATDASNACRTLLFNINKMCWDMELIHLFGANIEDLPEVRSSDACFGFYQGIPILGVMADSQAALLGEKCLKFGDVKITMGTGCSILMQLEENKNFNDNRILTTVAWKKSNQVFYAIEGIIRSCGDNINWFTKDFNENKKLEKLCEEVLQTKSDERVYFIPALQGLASPYWDNTMTASFLNMKRTTTQMDCLRAILESMIFQIKAVLDVMEKVTNSEIQQVHIDGGVIKNRTLMKLLATLLNKPVILNQVEELSALGVSSLACGEDQKNDLLKNEILPESNSEEIDEKYKAWQQLMMNSELLKSSM